MSIKFKSRNQKITKVGNSIYAKLDKAECERQGIKQGDVVDVTIETV